MDGLTDKDLGLIASFGIDLSVIIENIHNNVNTVSGERVLIEAFGDVLVFHISGTAKRVDRSYAITALAELQKTVSSQVREPYFEKQFTKWRLGNYRAIEPTLGAHGRPIHDWKRLPDQANASPSRENEPAHIDTPSRAGVQSGESDVEIPSKSLLIYNPFLYSLISLAIVYLTPFGVLSNFFIPFVILQTIVIVGSLYLYIQKSPRDVEDQKTPSYLKIWPEHTRIILPIAIPLLVAAMSYSIMMHKISRALAENGKTAMADISNIDQLERGNNEIIQVSMDLSFRDEGGRIIEARRFFSGSISQYIKCTNASQIEIKYMPDDPGVFEVIPPCITRR